MPEHALTSVIMVTEQTGPCLQRAIDSVLAQTAPVELVLVNNGNPPDVEAALVERFKDSPNVRLMTGHGAIGMARGYNLGARVASGETLLFVSAFSELPPHAVARLQEVEAKVKRPFMLGARLVEPTGREHKYSRRTVLTPKVALVEGLKLGAHFPKLRLYRHEDALPSKVVQASTVSRAFLYIHKEDFATLRGFDEAYTLYGDDMDFSARFRRKGGVAYFIPDLIITLSPEHHAVSVEQDKLKAKEMVHYLSENFGDTYFHPLLWVVYATIWGAFVFRLLGPVWIEKYKDYQAKAQRHAQDLKAKAQTLQKKR